MSILRVSEREESNESVGSYRYNKQAEPKYIASTLLSQCGWNLHRSPAVTTGTILEAYNATALIERAIQSSKNKELSHQSTDLLLKKKGIIKNQLLEKAASERKGTGTAVNAFSVQVSATKQTEETRKIGVSQFTHSNQSDFSLRFADKGAISSVLQKAQKEALNAVDLSTKRHGLDAVPTNNNPKKIENSSDNVQCINQVYHNSHGMKMSEQSKPSSNGLDQDSPSNSNCSVPTNGYNLVKNADSNSLNQALSVCPLSKLIEVDGVNYMVTMGKSSHVVVSVSLNVRC